MVGPTLPPTLEPSSTPEPPAPPTDEPDPTSLPSPSTNGGNSNNSSNGNNNGSTPILPITPSSPSLQTLGLGYHHIKYIQGYKDYQGVITVKPDNNITRAEVAIIFFRLLNDSNKNMMVPNAFSDINNKSWYTQSINYLAKIGVLDGYSDGTFHPDQPITRAEFTTIAAHFNTSIIESSNPFADVSPNYWAFNSIVTAYENGWIMGYPDGTFEPNNNITRAETVTIVNEMQDRCIEKLDIPTNLTNVYTDLSPDYWAFTNIIEASFEHDYTRKTNGYEIWTSYSSPSLP